MMEVGGILGVVIVSIIYSEVYRQELKLYIYSASSPEPRTPTRADINLNELRGLSESTGDPRAYC